MIELQDWINKPIVGLPELPSLRTGYVGKDNVGVRLAINF